MAKSINCSSMCHHWPLVQSSLSYANRGSRSVAIRRIRFSMIVFIRSLIASVNLLINDCSFSGNMSFRLKKSFIRFKVGIMDDAVDFSRENWNYLFYWKFYIFLCLFCFSVKNFKNWANISKQFEISCGDVRQFRRDRIHPLKSWPLWLWDDSSFFLCSFQFHRQ